MKSVLLAFSFIRVWRLFVSLLLWPLVIGLSLAVIQVLASSLYLALINETPEQFGDRFLQEPPTSPWLREQLWGSKEALGPLKICRWAKTPDGEAPLDGSCVIGEYDIALRVASPMTFDESRYSGLFQEATKTIHLCTSCTASLTIENADTGEPISHLNSIRALGVFALSESSRRKDIAPLILQARTAAEEMEDLDGTVLIHADSLWHPVNITEAKNSLIVILNMTTLLFMVVWLALRGHRKVLDYFARNNALLPMVAACGKETFYGALWIISLFRVGFFVLGAVPATWIAFRISLPETTREVFFSDPVGLLLWVAAILASLSAVTIVASIADLKHRHSWTSLLYRFLPLALWLFGTCAWALLVIGGERESIGLQMALGALPIVGFSQAVMHPVFHIHADILAAHTILASMLVLVILKANSRWFAAHLEEL